METRKEFNLRHPVTLDCTAFDQTQDFMKENPVTATSACEIPLPEISTRTDLTLAEAKVEYIELREHLKSENQPTYGWQPWVNNLIAQRLTYLRTTITDCVCEVKNGD